MDQITLKTGSLTFNCLSSKSKLIAKPKGIDQRFDLGLMAMMGLSLILLGFECQVSLVVSESIVVLGHN